MTVKELIAELEKMPQDSMVLMCVDPHACFGDIVWVERRYGDMVCLNDKYWTPYEK